MKFIVMVTMSLWDEPHRGRHHYALTLSQRHRVLWVNRRVGWRERGNAKTGIEVINEGLKVLHTGCSFFSGRVNERVNVDNLTRLRMLKKILPSMGKPDVIWIYDYKAINFAKNFTGDAVTLYFCNDHFGEYAFRRYEKTLVRLVDYVFATAPKLVDRFFDIVVPASFLPHGSYCDASIARFQKKKKPATAGYVGTLSHGIDIVFLQKFLDKTNLNLILAGPIIECTAEERGEFGHLLQHERVTYLGDVSQRDIQSVLEQIDVCLLPYAVAFNAQYRFVLKFFDYLSSGKPILATSYFEWPEPYKKFVRVFNDGENLQEVVKEIYLSWDLKYFDAALSLARECTWERRVKSVGDIIGMKL